MVDLPDPDGPIRAVTARALAVMLMSLSTWREPNHAFSPEASKATAAPDEESLSAASNSSGSGSLATANLPNTTREAGRREPCQRGILAIRRTE